MKSARFQNAFEFVRHTNACVRFRTRQKRTRGNVGAACSDARHHNYRDYRTLSNVFVTSRQYRDIRAARVDGLSQSRVSNVVVTLPRNLQDCTVAYAGLKGSASQGCPLQAENGVTFGHSSDTTWTSRNFCDFERAR